MKILSRLYAALIIILTIPSILVLLPAILYRNGVYLSELTNGLFDENSFTKNKTK